MTRALLSKSGFTYFGHECGFCIENARAGNNNALVAKFSELHQKDPKRGYDRVIVMQVSRSGDGEVLTNWLVRHKLNHPVAFIGVPSDMDTKILRLYRHSPTTVVLDTDRKVTLVVGGVLNPTKRDSIVAHVEKLLP